MIRTSYKTFVPPSFIFYANHLATFHFGSNGHIQKLMKCFIRSFKQSESGQECIFIAPIRIVAQIQNSIPIRILVSRITRVLQMKISDLF